MKETETSEVTETPVADQTVSTSTISLANAKAVFAGKEYRELIGRRKTSIARVRVQQSKKVTITINDKDVSEYFPVPLYRNCVLAPLARVGCNEGLSFTVVVHGGGVSGQAEAVRHGISRALVLLDPETRTTLKRAGYLKRDPRSKERKKPGLKKARKASQWSKR